MCIIVPWLGFVCLLLFYVLAKSKVITGRGPTCNSAHLWWLYSAASLGHGKGHGAHWHSHSVILSWHWANESLPYPNNAEYQARKWQVSIVKSLVRLDPVSKLQAPDSNPQSLDSLISQNGRRVFYSFSHPDWSPWLGCCKCLNIARIW